MRDRKTISKIAAATVIVVGVCLAVFMIFRQKPADNPSPINKTGSYCLKIPAKQLPCSVSLELANTEAARAQGLSGRDSLADDKGMLFDFDGIGIECMWMKDMKFSIDIIWLDAQDKVLKIEPNLSPATYPVSFCADSTKRVVELSTGSVARLGFHIGDQLSLTYSESP